MNFDRYLPEDHEPNAVRVSELYYLAQSEFIAPYPSVRLPSFPMFSEMTGGFRANEFTILCGATGTGKTTLAANWSLDMIEQDIPHFIASVETGATDYIKRMISARAGQDWNTGDRVPTDFLKVFNDQHAEKFKSGSSWVSLYDDRCAVEYLMADLAHMVKHHGCKVAIIDNLNFFMEVTSANQSVVEMDRVIHELIIFCKQLPIHIVMVMHPKKTDHGRVESEFDIKGSSTSVQEAHNVLLFNRVHPDLIKANVADEGDREIMIAKMRRKGKYVRRRIVIKARNGVTYFEGPVV